MLRSSEVRLGSRSSGRRKVHGGVPDGLPRWLVPAAYPFPGGCGLRFFGAEGSEVQRKLRMGVGLRVPPARCGQITGRGRNLPELFMAFFFSPLCFVLLLRLSSSELRQVETAAAAAGASVPLHFVG